MTVQKSNKHLFTINTKHAKTITSFPLSWYSSFLFPAEKSKLETIKMMGARSKIIAISLNVEINKPKSVDI